MVRIIIGGRGLDWCRMARCGLIIITIVIIVIWVVCLAEGHGMGAGVGRNDLARKALAPLPMSVVLTAIGMCFTTGLNRLVGGHTMVLGELF